MFPEAPLKVAWTHLTVPLTEPRIVGLDLFPAAPGLPQDGQNGRAVIFHMLLKCLPQADTLGVAAPTHKHYVQMLPDVV